MVRLCPICKSDDVTLSHSKLEGPLGLPERWVCRECGHEGYTFLDVDEEEIPKLRERKQPQTDEEKTRPQPLLERPLKGWSLWALGIALILFGLVYAASSILVGGLLIIVGILLLTHRHTG